MRLGHLMLFWAFRLPLYLIFSTALRECLLAQIRAIFICASLMMPSRDATTSMLEGTGSAAVIDASTKLDIDRPKHHG